MALGPSSPGPAGGDVRFKHEDLPATLIALAGGGNHRFQNQATAG